jgi:hypothetical protein
MRGVLLVWLILSVLLSPVVVLAQETPSFRLGFADLARQIPQVVGQPTEAEHYGPNGDSLQATTTGLMAWRRADNWTAFTNGSRTWINGPDGVENRANDEKLWFENCVGFRMPSEWMAMTLNAVSRTDTIGTFKAPEGQVFFVVDVTVENLGVNMIYSVSFELLDRENYRYSESFASSSLEHHLPQVSIAKGDKARGQVAFLVPRDVHGLFLDLHALNMTPGAIFRAGVD